MHHQGEHTTLEERVQINELARIGMSDSSIARCLGCSVWTVRKWRRRVQQQGRGGLRSQLGRPARGVLSTLPQALQTAIRDLRVTHPGWGPQTLLAVLGRDPIWQQQRLPSRSRLAAFLKQAGLTRRYQHHVLLPQPEAGRPQSVHEEWQLDAQGAMDVQGLGTVSVINVLDRFSRLKVESCPRVQTRTPSTQDYYLTLRRAFLSYGLPQRLSLDHDPVFFDNTCPSPFPMRLHLWLLALGIEVVFIRVRRPTDHGAVERMHQTMTNQSLRGQQATTLEQVWERLDQGRERLNQLMPTQALQQAPLEAFPHARHSGRPYRPEWEEQLLDLERVYRYLAQGRWFRPTHQGAIQLGSSTYRLGTAFEKQTLEITFDPQQVAFVCQPQGNQPPITVAAQGLTKADLMGDLALLLQLPAYQLALPFSVEAQRQLALVECLTGTTL
jgi:DNA-binding CsgD family transcriptional regulator